MHTFSEMYGLGKSTVMKHGPPNLPKVKKKWSMLVHKNIIQIITFLN